jgi:hypothetical protein
MAIQRITSGIIADGAIVATDIGDGVVTASKIADANVTSSKLASTLSISGNFLANNITANTNIVANTGSAAAPSIFPTGDTNTGIFFPAADTIAFAEGGAEAMRIDANGRVGIGTTSPGYPLNVSMARGGTAQDIAALTISGTVSINDAMSLAFTNGSVVTSRITNIYGPDANVYGSLAFLTRNFNTDTIVEVMRLDNRANLLVGKTAIDGEVAGGEIRSTGNGLFVRSAGACLFVNRLTDDGTVVEIAQATTVEGTISVSGSTVSYNQFMGSHWAALTDWSRPNIKIGTILDSINELVIYKYVVIDVNGEQKKICYNGNAEVGATVSVEYEDETYEGIVELERDREFTKAVKVKINDTAASKAVYGVFVAWNTDKNGDGGIWNDMYVGAVGNYVVRMAEGQEPQIGDLIEADGNGCGVVQEDDIIRSKTVGKVTSNIPQVTYDDGSFLVTCVLYSG